MVRSNNARAMMTNDAVRQLVDGAVKSAIKAVGNSAQTRRRAGTAQAKAGPRRRQTNGVRPDAIRHQPRGLVPRGSFPDPAAYHWGQTPSSSNVIAPRGFGYYDAFANPPSSAMTAMSIGPATPITGTSLFSVKTNPKYDWNGPIPLTAPGAQLLIVYPAPTTTQAMLVSPTVGAQGEVVALDPATFEGFTSTQLLADAPQQVIPTRCSLRLRNTTEAVSVGGVIRTLRLTTGLKLDAGNTNNMGLQSFIEQIRANPRTRHYDGNELMKTHQKNCSVVDQSRSTAFAKFQTAVPQPYTDEFSKSLEYLTYTPIAIVFEAFEAHGNRSNEYEINVCSQFLSHYIQGSMLAAMAIDPKSSPPTINKQRDREESTGSGLLPVIEGALGSLLGAGAANALGNFGMQTLPKLAPLIAAV